MMLCCLPISEWTNVLAWYRRYHCALLLLLHLGTMVSHQANKEVSHTVAGCWVVIPTTALPREATMTTICHDIVIERVDGFSKYLCTPLLVSCYLAMTICLHVSLSFH